jgi:hypothetical protein
LKNTATRYPSQKGGCESPNSHVQAPEKFQPQKTTVAIVSC